MKLFISLSALLFLVSCGATMVQPPSHEFGPSEGPQIGKIMYGPFTIGQSDAYKKMHQACHGKYKILDQKVVEKYPTTTFDARAKNDKVHAEKSTSSEEYTYITFECLELKP